jgi:hypothetical protein
VKDRRAYQKAWREKQKAAHAAAPAPPATNAAPTNGKGTATDLLLSVIERAKRPLSNKELMDGLYAAGWQTKATAPNNVVTQMCHDLKQKKKLKKFGTGNKVVWGFPAWKHAAKAAQQLALVAEEEASGEAMLTTHEAGRILGTTPGTVRSLVNRGQLTATKVKGKGPGGMIAQIKRADVEALKAARAAG